MRRLAAEKLGRVNLVCAKNSNRSQMAEAFTRIHGAGKVEIGICF
jgi:arsenate reductase (thioredoxin)